MTTSRMVFTTKDRQAWELVQEIIPDPDDSALMSNGMMASHLSLKEGRMGSRHYRRLELFGLIRSEYVMHPEAHNMCRRVHRLDKGEAPAWTQASAMVIIHEMSTYETAS